jgi:hypothetical protein
MPEQQLLQILPNARQTRALFWPGEKYPEKWNPQKRPPEGGLALEA